MASGDGNWNWNSFMYKSDSGRYRQNNSVIHYNHWLPEDQEDLLPENLEDENLSEIYEEFDTLVHATTLENANAILRDGFKPRPVVDNSVVNNTYRLMDCAGREIIPRPQHPVRDVNILWYGPCTFQRLQDPTYVMKRYGNVVFSMNSLYGYEGLIRKGLNLYFIEVIEYLTSSASRILVSHRDYPELRKFDPYKLGGPLYIKETRSGHRFYYTSSLKRRDGQIVKNVLEIMQEEFNKSGYLKIGELRLNNHFVSFCYCKEAKKDVSEFVVPLSPGEDETQDGIMPYLIPNILKLAIVLATSRNPTKILLLTQFDTEQKRDQKLREELERVHQEADRKYKEFGKEGLNTASLIDMAVQGIMYMSKRDIVHSYLNMLLLIPESQHSEITESLWKKISNILMHPITE
ncbi:uncharacterized protein LOC133203743 [Saccostrea echinata]|uniref:uncharacterized protein LOC133203743 n=1 Tax=Saccostrea echinata TaxID=191078 RepID=UPI002A8067FB|nr:uncharacterized protein LOC133203743 [Saccostrea echinata]